MPATVSNRQHRGQDSEWHSQNCMNSFQIFWLAYSLSEQALQASTHVHALMIPNSMHVCTERSRKWSHFLLVLSFLFLSSGFLSFPGIWSLIFPSLASYSFQGHWPWFFPTMGRHIWGLAMHVFPTRYQWRCICTSTLEPDFFKYWLKN